MPARGGRLGAMRRSRRGTIDEGNSERKKGRENGRENE